MKTSWAPWGVVTILVLVFFWLIINGTINFDGPDMSLSGNDIRPPNVRSFRINGVRTGDVIAVIDSVVLTPAELEDPNSSVENNIIQFRADISDENRIDRVELTLYRLLPRPFLPAAYEIFELEAPYRFDWDASNAPNGLYGVRLRVTDDSQNEALVYPDVQLALLRFGDISSQVTPAAPATAQMVVQPTTQASSQTQAQPQIPQPTEAQPSATPATNTQILTPQSTTASNAQSVSTTPSNIRRRDLVFTVLATIFFAILVRAGQLFTTKWPQDHLQDYISIS